MSKTKYNKTYKKQNTKRNNKINKTAIALGFSIFFLLTAINAFQDSILYNKIIKSQNNTKQSTLNIKDLTIITLTSNNPTNEQIAYLAAFQACDALLPNYKPCVNEMIAIAKTENTDFSFNTPGNDSYQSSGLYQISLYYHPNLTLSQINDPYFAANWTLRRLIANGYPTNRDISIMKHNGTPNISATIKYLSKVNNYITNSLNK